MRRPVLRYYGGKHRLARLIVPLLPAHTVYVEPFGGAFSVGLAKPKAHHTVYNDLDGRLVALFRVLRDPARAEQLRRAVELTPYSRAEWEQAASVCDELVGDEVELARSVIVRAWMSHGSTGLRDQRTGFRKHCRRAGNGFSGGGVARPRVGWVAGHRA